VNKELIGAKNKRSNLSKGIKRMRGLERYVLLKEGGGKSLKLMRF